MTAFVELGVLIIVFAFVAWAIRKKPANRDPGDKRRPD